MQDPPVDIEEDRLAASLHYAFLLASVVRDGAAHLAAAFGGPGAEEAVFRALSPEDQVPWRAAARRARHTSPPPPAAEPATYAQVSLMGNNTLGLCRLERAELCGAAVWRVTVLERYPWRVLWLRTGPLYKAERVEEAEALRFARAARRRGEAALAAAAAGREALAAVTATIALVPSVQESELRRNMEDDIEGTDLVVTLSAEVTLTPDEVETLSARIRAEISNESPGPRFPSCDTRWHRGRGGWVVCAAPEQAPLVALALRRSGFGRVLLPGGTEFVPPPEDTSDPFLDAAPHTGNLFPAADDLEISF